MQWKNKSSFSEDAIADYLANNQSSLLVQNDKLFSNYIFWSCSISRKCKLKAPLYVIIFAVISFVFFVLFYYIAERTYLKGVIGLSTSTAKKQVISAEGLQKSTVQSSHLKAYVKRI